MFNTAEVSDQNQNKDCSIRENVCDIGGNQ